MSGKLVVSGTNTPFLPRGFTSIGVVYPTPYATKLCSGTFQASAAVQGLQAAQAALTAAPLSGLSYNASFQAMVQDWYANSVRLQVSQGALQYEYANGLSAYTDMVRNAIAQARAAGLVAIVAMQSELYSCTPYENGAMQKLPDDQTEQAWKQLLDSALTDDNGVVLEIFNEPSTTKECNAGTLQQPSWTDWATGCGTEPQQGMLTVGQYLRTLAPNNVLLFDGDDIDFAFTGFVAPSGIPANSAYTFHPYSYVVNSNESDSSSAWDSRFGDFANSGNALVVTEWNESFGCPSDPNQTITNDFVQNYLPAHSIGILGYGWDAPVVSSGYLVNSYSYSGNTANYNVVDPNSAGCSTDGGKLLQSQFKSEAGL